MDSTKIDDYRYELQGLCSTCKKFNKCKDKQQFCLRKRFAFNIARVEYKRRLKKSEIK